MKKIITILLSSCTIISCSSTGIITDDRDNQSYKIAKINGKWWTVQNMNFKVDGFQYYNDQKENEEKSGKLYNWEQAQKVCPSGWRLPAEQELIDLLLPYGKISYSGVDEKYKQIFGEYDPRKTEATYFKIFEDKNLNIPVFNGNFVENQRTMIWSSVTNSPDRAFAIYWRKIDENITYNSVHFSDYPKHYFGFCRCVSR